MKNNFLLQKTKFVLDLFLKQKYILLLATLVLFIPKSLNAQTAGPNNPATGANVNTTGTVLWTNSGNITNTADLNYAAAVFSGSANSNYLQGSNYGFAIPSGAIINGIVVTINRRTSATNAGRVTRDNVVSLVKGGVITGNNKFSATAYTTSFATVSYGSVTDTWGTTWTPADINASNFGAVLSVNANNTLTATVDHIRITIHYTTITFSSTNACTGSSSTVVIDGNNLIGTTAVTFNGSAATFIQTSNTRVTTTLPAGATTGPITLTTPSGTATSASNFSVNPLPTVAPISGTTSVCVGATTTLSNATASGTWSSASSNATINSSVIVTGVSSGSAIITYSFTDGNGCTNSVNTTVTVNTLPVVSSTASVCLGNTIQLTPNSGGTWTSSNNTLATVDNTGLVTGVSIGSPTFTFTDSTSNCSKTTNAVNILALPAISLQPIATQTICSGSSVSFSVSATGPGLTYQWYNGATALINVGSISGATSATLTINPVTTGDASANYNCVVSGTCSPTAPSANAELIVIEKVTLTSQPVVTQTLCTGDTATFVVSVNNANISYQWYKGTSTLTDGGSISGATTNTLTINPIVTGDAATNYNCVVSETSPCSAVTSNNAALVVNQLPAITAHPVVTQTICSGAAVSFSVTAKGTSLTYQWFNGATPMTNGASVSGATSATLTINPTTTANVSASYNCVVSGTCTPSVASNNATLIVNSLSVGGSAKITHTANSSGTMVALPTTVSTHTDCHFSSGIIALNGQTGVVLRWESSTDAGNTWLNLGGAGNTTFNYTNAISTTSFRAVVQNAFCNITYSTAAILFVIPNIKPLPVSASPSTICAGQSTTLTSLSGYSSSQNVQYGGLFNTANPLGWLVDGNGVFSASGDNGNPTAFKETNGNGGSEYNTTSDDKFAIARGNLDSTLQTPIFDLFGLSSANLTFDHAHKLVNGAWGKVELSFNGGATYPVTLATYTGNQGPYNQFNTARSINLNAYLGYTNLRIRFNYHGLQAKAPGIAGDAWVIDNVTIPQAPVPALTSLWSDITSNATVSVTNATNVTVYPTVTTTYAVTSFLNGCTSYGAEGTTHITVTINQLPIVTASSPTICSGDLSSIPLSSTVTGTQTSTTFTWTVAQTDTTGGSAGSGSAINQTLTATGTVQGTATYTITPTANGCIGPARTIEAIVNPRPKADIQPSQTICYGGTATFSITLEGTGPWNLAYSNGVATTTVNGITTNPYIFSVSGMTVNRTFTITALSDARCTARSQDLTGAAVVTVLTGTAGVWTGLVSTDWFDCKNWQQGLPSPTIDAQIPTITVAGRMPVIDRTSPFAAAYSFIATARDLIVATGASITMVATNNSELQISRDWKNSGNFIPGTGTVTFNGASVNQIHNINLGIKTNETFYNLTTNTSNSAIGISVVDGFELTVANNLSLLSGDIRLVGEAQIVQNGTAANPSSGTGKILKDQQGNRSSYHYNYWSSPVTTNGTNYSLSGVLRDGTDSATNSFNQSPITFGSGAYFADGAITTPIKISTSWLFKYTSVSTVYAGWQFIGNTGTVNIGEGFTMKGVTGIAPFTTPQNYVFVGKPNNGTIPLSISLNQSYLVGNPYPSGLDADEFIKDNIKDGAGRAATNIFNGTLYFWDHFGGQTHILNQYIGGYSSYTLRGGVVAISNDPLINADGSMGTKVPKRYIPVAQGFFIGTGSNEALTGNNPSLSTAITGGTINFKNSQRAFKIESVSNSVFFKSNNQNHTVNDTIDARQKIRLLYQSPSNIYRQILVGVDENTTSYFDVGYDAPIIDENAEDLYWNTSDAKLTIQAVSNFNEEQILPLGLKTSTAGICTIKVDTLENISEDTQLYIHDAETGADYNIKNSDFTITLPIGIYNDRFSLRFTANALGTTNPSQIDTFASIFNNIIRIESNEFIKKISIYDIAGKLINNYSLTEIKKQFSDVFNYPNGVYIAKITLDNGFVVAKKLTH